MGDKTEEPTPKKLREAKKKGQVGMSRDLGSAMTFVVGFSVLIGTGSVISESLKGEMRDFLTLAVTTLPNTDSYYNILVHCIVTIIKNVAPILASVMLMGTLVAAAQVGGIFTFEPLMPKFSKINPLQGIKKWFSAQSLVELAKSLVKLIVAAYIAYAIVRDMLHSIVLSVGSSLENMSFFLNEMIKSYTIRVAVVFIVVAAADFAFQRYQWKKGLKMDKEEVKREYKEEEGDPMYKGKRKQMHQEFAFNSMMKNARKASVVVVNPTHMAVALFYDRSKGAAPTVLAKGQNLVAEQLKQLAKECRIPIVRNITLAQALNKVDLGEEVPEELYQAVAEVLNFIYRLGQGR